MVKTNKNNTDINIENKNIIQLDTREGSEYDKADTMLLDTREGSEYDNVEIVLENDNMEFSSCHSQTKMPSSCHSRAMTRESSRKMNHCFSGYSCQSTNMTGGNNNSNMTEGNNALSIISQSGHIPPSVTLGRSETKTRGSRITNAYASAFRIAQSGRSMVEMLGVLAVIGVLSIGGIMGYSYGMDKYRANETTNQIRLRAIDLMAQAAQGNENLSLAGWENEATLYDFGEVGLTTDNLIYMDMSKLPKRICEMVYDNMKDMAIQIDINAVRANTNIGCVENSDNNYYGENVNEMTFYFDPLNSSASDRPCPANHYYENGICFSSEPDYGGSIPSGPYEGECILFEDWENPEKCGQCHYCRPEEGNMYSCYPNYGGECSVDGKTGTCYAGECYIDACTTNDDCTEVGTYCAGDAEWDNPVRFPKGTGICKPFDFIRFEVNEKTYYLDNRLPNWWDAEYACDALGKWLGKDIKMVDLDDLVINIDGHIGEPTELLKKLDNMGWISLEIWTTKVSDGWAQAVATTGEIYPFDLTYPLHTLCK